ncbi:hypothetical protein WA026_006490 [Henosepilachna vigintioctopunctata]|uniref:2',5'-phosphodiesterase 12 n=1 Tax=Henosepilachna vigintioctopunctata TaxID=420089 RepID=A0AAW1UFV1_9CUCU
MLLKYVGNIFYYPNRLLHKYIFKMDKAYFRRIEETEQFHFTFRYTNKDLKVDRQFNFTRQISEPVSVFLGRLNTNIEKIVIRKNKKKSSENIPTELNIKLRINGEDVLENKLCDEVFIEGNRINLSLPGQMFDVVINSPWIETLALPSSILATYPVYPSKFEAFHTNFSQSKFIWYTSKEKKDWMEVSKNHIFEPQNNLVESYLKLICTPINNDVEGPSVEVESNDKIQAGPGVCPFEMRHQFTRYRSWKNVFRIVTYNILADLYCDSDFSRDSLYAYCPPYALQLDYRKQLILKELMGYNADIICLQEVDRKVFKHDLQPFLSFIGLQGEYAIKGGEVAEGVACFFRSNKFSLLKTDRIVFCEHIDKDPLFSYIWSKVVENPKLVTRILELKTTLQTVLLQSTDNENELLFVANTHLYFHPDADHIRLLQAGFAITFIQNSLETIKKEYPEKRISLVFCGDFNSIPDCGIYKLFTTGSVPEDFIDYKSNAEEAVKNLKLEQNIPLASACGTPQFTNFTSGFADCLDYIFYQTNNLKVTQVVPLPSNEELTQNTALPSIVFPSDHIALISDIQWL